MLRLARRAASTLALPASPAATSAELGALAGRATADEGGDLELALQVTGVGEDLPDWLRHRMGLTPDGLRDAGAVAMLSGDVDRDAEALERLREQTGISYLTVPGDFAKRLSPLVARLSGR